MTVTPAIIAVAGILCGTAALVLRRAEARAPDPTNVELPSALTPVMVVATGWVAVVPLIPTLAFLAGPVAALAALAFVLLALLPHYGTGLVRFYRLQILLAITALILSCVAGLSIISAASLAMEPAT